MARCNECLHYEVCAKEGRLVQVDEHTWDEYNKLDDVEQFCTNYFTADVVPKSEVDWNSIPVDVSEALKQRAVEKAKTEFASEIFAEIEKIATSEGAYDYISIQEIAELKKKYTESEG